MTRGVFSPANTFISITDRHVVGNSSTGEISFGQIQRAFKRKDLEYISSQIKVHFSIQWKWPFRYLWIMRKDFIN